MGKRVSFEDRCVELKKKTKGMCSIDEYTYTNVEYHYQNEKVEHLASKILVSYPFVREINGNIIRTTFYFLCDSWKKRRVPKGYKYVEDPIFIQKYGMEYKFTITGTLVTSPMTKEYDHVGQMAFFWTVEKELLAGGVSDGALSKQTRTQLLTAINQRMELEKTSCRQRNQPVEQNNDE